jgi:hypothetical protein
MGMDHASTIPASGLPENQCFGFGSALSMIGRTEAKRNLAMEGTRDRHSASHTKAPSSIASKSKSAPSDF